MISVERLRIWLLAAAGLLTVVLLAFLGYAHLRAHQFLTKLPGKLGVDLRQEANGFTYSQSVKGKTVFTIHATKAIQHLNGKVTLQDVGHYCLRSGAQSRGPHLRERVRVRSGCRNRTREGRGKP